MKNGTIFINIDPIKDVPKIVCQLDLELSISDSQLRSFFS